MSNNEPQEALTDEEMEYQIMLKDMAKVEIAEEDYHIDHELAGVGAGLSGGSKIQRN